MSSPGIDASVPPRRSRRGMWLLIWGMAVLELVYVLAGGWRLGSARPGWLTLLGAAIRVATIVAIVVGVVRSQRWMDLLVAPDRRVFMITTSEINGWVAAFVLGSLTTGGGSVRQASVDFGLPWLVWLAAGIAVVCLAVLVAVLVALGRGRPSIEVRPGGVRIRGMLRRYDVPWEALAPASSTTALTIARPELVTGNAWAKLRPDSISLPVQPQARATVHAIVERYVAHPEHRGAVGTVAEYGRLRALRLV